MRPIEIAVGDVELMQRVERGLGDLFHLKCTPADETQLARIDKAGLDEASRLPAAPTGVVGVDETAVAVHEAVQVATRARQLLSERITRYLEQLSTDDIGNAEYLAKDVDKALLAIETQ